jgi:hypothetical protein
MTLHEIEETLRTLIARHPGLDGQQLLTLLRAGGWEEKTIEEAKTVFRSMKNVKTADASEKQPTLPPLVETPVFTPPPDRDHLLLAKNKKPAPDEAKVSERESLIVPESHSSSKREELPHNLPLRPFETSEHIWPFSRYKDVFYGDLDEPTPLQAPKKEEPAQEKVFVQVETPIAPPPQKRDTLPKIAAPQPPAYQTSSRGDEKLVILASVMLLIILILLGYMYSNGRL